MICIYCDCDVPDGQEHRVPGGCLDILKKEKESLIRQLNAVKASELNWKTIATRKASGDGKAQI